MDAAHILTHIYGKSRANLLRTKISNKTCYKDHIHFYKTAPSHSPPENKHVPTKVNVNNIVTNNKTSKHKIII